MRRTLYFSSVILMSLFLFAHACVDHQIPGTPPQLETLKWSSGNGWKCSYTFNLDIKDVGTMPVKEYGIVYTFNGIGNPRVGNPVVESDMKEVFPMPFLPGPKSKLSGDICGPNVYYRAYAILENNSVVYGQEIAFNYN
jgi:hypothetical protein